MASKEEPKDATKGEEAPKEETTTTKADDNKAEEGATETDEKTGAADDGQTAPAGQTDGNAAKENDEEKNRRVYVGNLAWEVSWQDLKDLMKSTGHDVTRADIMQTPDGRSKGCGIVEFSTAEGAKQAVLTLNDTELMGRQIFVREDREDRGRSGGNHRFFSSGEKAQSRRVYVGNLSWDVAWPDLKDHMRQAGEVVHAEVICEHNGRSKGCGIVEYATDEEAKKAISTLTHTELNGRTIFVREDRETSSAGGAGGGGGGGGGPPSGPRPHNTSVYVWNLSYETTWQELKDHMRKAGNVDQATILTDPDGNSIGCGIVVYQKAHDASRAIRELQDSELKGRAMHLREDRVQSGSGGGGGGGGGRGHYHHSGRGGGRGGRGGGRGYHHYGGRGGGGDNQPSGEPGCQLFVSNLSFQTTWRELKDHFKQCGEVERADVKMSEGKSRGFGTVRFTKAQDAEAAIAKLNGAELQGRALEVRLDHKA